MLDHVSLTVTDFAAAEAFYDAVMAALGAPKAGSDEAQGWIGYGDRSGAQEPRPTYFSVRVGGPVEDAPRRHLCFRAPSRTAVDAFWRAGLEAGGTDNGAPGLRDYHRTYYAAFLIDPAGNRIEAVCHDG